MNTNNGRQFLGAGFGEGDPGGLAPGGQTSTGGTLPEGGNQGTPVGQTGGGPSGGGGGGGSPQPSPPNLSTSSSDASATASSGLPTWLKWVLIIAAVGGLGYFGWAMYQRSQGNSTYLLATESPRRRKRRGGKRRAKRRSSKK